MNSPLPSVNLVDFALSQINKQPTGSLEISSGTSLGSLNINDVLTLDFIQTIADSSSSSAVKVQISANGQTLVLSPDAKLELPLPQNAFTDLIRNDDNILQELQEMDSMNEFLTTNTSLWNQASPMKYFRNFRKLRIPLPTVV